MREADELLSSQMRVPLRELRGDISQLADSWESIMHYSLSGSERQAIRALAGLVSAYLRGKGYRMGNFKGLRKHGLKLALGSTAVLKVVIGADKIEFPTLHALGYDSWETANDRLRIYGWGRPFDIMEEAENILKESPQ